ncbi:hypothetical protein KL912_004517 [Ogataea haglerorum]|nr:hypothetical protein KL912_004517 [Ogataea haglerorum]
MDGDNLEFEDSYTFNPRILSSIEFGSILETLSKNQSVPVNIPQLVNDAQNYESRLLEHEINLEDEPEYSPNRLKMIFGYLSYPLLLVLKYTIPMMSMSDFNQTIKPSFSRLMKLLCSLSCAQFIIIYSFAENASWGISAIFLVLTTLTVVGVYYNITRADPQSNLLKLLICIIGFITAIAYIAFIADELINVLKFISVLTQLKCRLSTDGTGSMFWRPVAKLAPRNWSQRQDRRRGQRQHETQLVFDLSLDSRQPRVYARLHSI